MEVSVIIPTLNEEANIAHVLARVPREIWRRGEVIVVDSSTDRTPDIARRFGARVIKVPRRGKGFALKVGAELATKDIIVFMDGDGQDPPEYIPLMIRALNFFDVVLCARHPAHPLGNFVHRIISYVSMNFVRLVFKNVGFHVRGDPLPGFRAMRKETWRRIIPKSNNFLFETEMNINIARLGLKVLEIPIPIIPRGDSATRSKFLRSFDQQIKLIAMPLRYRKFNLRAHCYFLLKALRCYIPCMRRN